MFKSPLNTRSYLKEEEQVRWVSSGAPSFTVLLKSVTTSAKLSSP